MLTEQVAKKHISGWKANNLLCSSKTNHLVKFLACNNKESTSNDYQVYNSKKSNYKISEYWCVSCLKSNQKDQLRTKSKAVYKQK